MIKVNLGVFKAKPYHLLVNEDNADEVLSVIRKIENEIILNFDKSISINNIIEKNIKNKNKIIKNNVVKNINPIIQNSILFYFKTNRNIYIRRYFIKEFKIYFNSLLYTDFAKCKNEPIRNILKYFDDGVSNYISNNFTLLPLK